MINDHLNPDHWGTLENTEITQTTLYKILRKKNACEFRPLPSTMVLGLECRSSCRDLNLFEPYQIQHSSLFLHDAKRLEKLSQSLVLRETIIPKTYERFILKEDTFFVKHYHIFVIIFLKHGNFRLVWGTTWFLKGNKKKVISENIVKLNCGLWLIGHVWRIHVKSTTQNTW